MEVALQWTESTDETIRSYVNGIRTSAGGTHENGFKSGIVKAIRNYMETHEIKIKGLNITRRGHPRGHRRHPVGVRARADVPGADQGEAEQPGADGRRSTTSSGRRWKAWLNANMTAADQIVGRIVLAAKARLASREAASEVKRKSVDAAPAQPARQAGRLQIDRPGRDRNCSSSRATSPAARPSRAATTRRRPCCRCAARSSTPRAWPLSKVLANAELTDLVIGHRHRRRREVRPRRPALRQDHPADGRRRRRPPHHDAAAGVLLPPHDRS